MPATALLRAAARVVESDGDGGQGLDGEVWARLEALPDPRSPQGRIYSLASLVAVALCALTAAGHDRLTGIGQWARRAGPAERARLDLPVRDATTPVRSGPVTSTAGLAVLEGAAAAAATRRITSSAVAPRCTSWAGIQVLTRCVPGPGSSQLT